MFETIENWFSAGWASVKSGAADVSQTWSDAVADLKAKAAQFMQLFTRLKSIQSQTNLSESERARVDSIVRRGELVKSTVGALVKGIDGIANVLPRNLLSGVARSGGLGIIPLLPIAAIAAAIAVMAAWISDAIVELERLELAEKVRQGGGDPATVLGSGRAINWVLIGGGVLVVAGALYFINKPKGRR